MAQPTAPFAIFAGVLAMAGLPIYVHAPKFYVDAHGVSLAGLGAVLFGLRLFDFAQDPFLGWLSRRLRHRRTHAVALATAVMALAMVGLFAVKPPMAPLAWFALTLTLLFSSFSFLTINFYAQGVVKAENLGTGGHLRLAGWRETGGLIGICLAAIAPLGLALITPSPFALFAALFALACLVAWFAMRAEWRTSLPETTAGLLAYLRYPLTRRLLLLALVNAMPVAVTSTLFLFFVEYRLAAPGWEGPLLLLFFLAAALSAPFWSRAAQIHGTKEVLLAGMTLAVLTFAGAAFLGAGDVLPFVVVCIASGAALGADMTLLPALFAKATTKVSGEAAEGFGLWSFASKFSLALAAVVFLPLLDAFDVASGTGEPFAGTWVLTFSYAVVPLGLKLAAIALLAATRLEQMAPPSDLQGVHP